MKAALLFLACVCGVVAAEKSPPPEPPKVDCRGVIVEFVKDGFQGATFDGTSGVRDITWVVVETPKEFAGVRSMLLSHSEGTTSPLGKVGDRISFTAYRSTLESEKSNMKADEKSRTRR